jgi:hypothetical protein
MSRLVPDGGRPRRVECLCGEPGRQTADGYVVVTHSLLCPVTMEQGSPIEREPLNEWRENGDG